MKDTKNAAVQRVPRKAGDRLKLGARITAVHAKALHAAAGVALATGRKITIEANETEYIDPAAAQVLLALQLSCRSKGVPLAWNGPAPAARESLERFGLGAALAPVEPTR